MQTAQTSVLILGFLFFALTCVAADPPAGWELGPFVRDDGADRLGPLITPHPGSRPPSPPGNQISYHSVSG